MDSNEQNKGLSDQGDRHEQQLTFHMPIGFRQWARMSFKVEYPSRQSASRLR